MKILWIVNMVFPKIAKKLGAETSASGGWLLDLADGISADPNVELTVMTYYGGEFKDIKVDNIRYILFPGGGNRLLFDSNKTAEDCKKALELCQPDLVHIHGTEYAPGYEMLKVCGDVPVLLTIQGILRRISKEYYGGLTFNERLKCLKLKEILTMKTPTAYKMLYSRNAEREEKVLKQVKYVTGRTDWDKAVMLSVNPNLKYFRCNYNLRKEFYESEKWSLESCERHTVFSSSALYSLKGLHIEVKAIALLKKKYPDIKLYVPGGCAENGKIKNPSGYIKYINRLIKKYGLEDNIIFTGSISPSEVAKRLRKANVFVVSSAVEGASASLCEAMMIGTPSVSSFRGGMTDLLTDRVNGFTYDYSEYPMLACRIDELFSNDKLACEFSKRTIPLAEERHKREKNPKDMIEVYNEVIANERKD